MIPRAISLSNVRGIVSGESSKNVLDRRVQNKQLARMGFRPKGATNIAY